MVVILFRTVNFLFRIILARVKYNFIKELNWNLRLVCRIIHAPDFTSITKQIYTHRKY